MAEPTKAELIEQATLLGLTVDDSMTKAEIQAMIDEAQGTEPFDPDAQPPPEGDPSPPVGPKVCAICGEPATRVSSSTAYSPAYYCDEHNGGEALKGISD